MLRMNFTGTFADQYVGCYLECKFRQQDFFQRDTVALQVGLRGTNIDVIAQGYALHRSGSLAGVPEIDALRQTDFDRFACAFKEQQSIGTRTRVAIERDVSANVRGESIEQHAAVPVDFDRFDPLDAFVACLVG